MGNSQFTIGAFGIIFDKNNKVLLCHRRDYEIWNLPGGAAKDLESPWEAVIREVKEETGLNVEVERFVGVYAKNFKNDIVFSFICRKISGKLTLNEEAAKVEYFDVGKLPDNTIPHQVERIKDALKYENQPILKIQRESRSFYKVFNIKPKK